MARLKTDVPGWWNGRHATLKMLWEQSRMGSSPIPGTPKEKDGNLVAVFFYSLHSHQSRLSKILSLADELVVVASNDFFLLGW